MRTEEEKVENDPVECPSHYVYGKIECIDFIDSCGYGLGFCLGNAIKYITRCGHKGTTEQDLRKVHESRGRKDRVWRVQNRRNCRRIRS